MPSRLRPRFKFALAAPLAAVLVLAAPLAAAAHVRLDPGTAQPGAEVVQLTFSVPTESAKATTTGVTVTLPTTTPFLDVSVQPVPGWTARVVRGALPKPVTVEKTRVTEAPLQVIWTAAAGTSLGADQFQDFSMAVGPVPDTSRVLLPVAQSYSDGSVVRWNQPTPPSGDEPEHPAPTLYIRDAPPSDGEAAAAPVAGASSAAASGPALALSIAALVVALAGLAVALLALLRRGRAR